MARIEIWFTNGLFRAYPEVNTNTIKNDGKVLIFEFAGGHRASIILSNVNFIEDWVVDK